MVVFCEFESGKALEDKDAYPKIRSQSVQRREICK